MGGERIDTGRDAAGPGGARRGWAWLGGARPGEARQGRRGEAWPGAARSGLAGKARRDRAWPDPDWQNMAGMVFTAKEWLAAYSLAFTLAARKQENDFY